MIKSCITWIIIMNQHRGTKQITYQPACGWDITLLRGCFQWKPLNWSCCSHGMKKHLWLLSGYVSFSIYLFILFLLQLGLCSWTWALSSCSEWRSLFTAVHGLLSAVASRCRAQVPGARASVVAAHGLRSCGTQPLGLHFWYKELRMYGLVSLSSFWL